MRLIFGWYRQYFQHLAFEDRRRLDQVGNFVNGHDDDGNEDNGDDKDETTKITTNTKTNDKEQK